MDDKQMGAVPPYNANPSQGMQHTGAYGAAPGQPMVQQDIYQQPLSPMQTGQTYPQQPQQPQQPHHTGTMASPGTEKQEYYSPGQQQAPPMGQVQQAPMGQPTSQYQTAYPLASLTETPAPVDCPCCHHRALTTIESHSGNTTHVWALVICACLCLGCIPYLINSLKDVEHKCSNCGVLLATWKRSGRTVVHQHA